jgi:hypothetical protein
MILSTERYDNLLQLVQVPHRAGKSKMQINTSLCRMCLMAVYLGRRRILYTFSRYDIVRYCQKTLGTFEQSFE